MTEKTIYALGFFDGVHAGHAALLRACRTMAEAQGLPAGVITFTSHPDTLVTGVTPALINTPADRERLLRRSVDRVTELSFDKALMDTPWQTFFAMLLHKYNAGGLVCGHDFRFGAGGAGTAQTLREACKQAGIPCTVVPEQKIDGVTVSSTYIRRLLEQGQMETACRFLGHPHILTGTVVPGRQLGRTMGIPTANFRLPEGLVSLRHGVYACQALVEGRTYLAVTNIGTRPTVCGSHVTAEAWLLDFGGDLYGKTMTLQFYAFLRPEKKFSDLAALQAEIRENARQVQAFFGKK